MTISSSNKSVVCPILIGRSSELAALQGLIEQAKSGSGQIALLSGEAGVGKSRLVGETKMYAASQGFLLLQGNCFPTDISCPYAPVLDLLRSLFATRPPAEIAAEVRPFAHELYSLLPDIVPLSPDQPPLPTLDREQEKRRLFTALVGLFTSQATKQPVLLVVEDLHWSDDTSLEFLHYLARRCVAQPLALLLTYRNDEIHPSLRHWLAQVDREHLAQEFVLSRLTRNDVDTMLRAIFELRRSAGLELPDPIYTLTEGNPFFIEEVLKTQLTVGEIFYMDGAWHLKPHKGNPASRPHISRMPWMLAITCLRLHLRPYCMHVDRHTKAWAILSVHAPIMKLRSR